jgi:hypothetical protein
MAINGLRRRVERLEAAAGAGKSGTFEQRLRRFAAGLNLDPEQLILVTKGHEAALSPCINDDGGITWPAFCQLREFLAEAGQ